MEKLSPLVVDQVFGGENATTPEVIEPQVKVEMKDSAGKTIATGSLADSKLSEDWVARVSSMSLSIKVTPKIGDTYVSVGRDMTIDLNTLDKAIVQGVWKDLQKQVISGVFDSLTMTIKQLSEARKV